MFRWDKERAIDLACIHEITVPEIASILGTSVSSLEKFYSRNRAELFSAKNDIAVSESVYFRVMDFWGEGIAQNEIALRLDISTDTVRRLILNAEYDEAADDTGAAAELAALREAHPDRLYEDDVRALIDLPASRPDTREYILPFSQDKTWMPPREKSVGVTLARAAA